VNYADDFVILCRRNAAEARERMEAIMAKKIRVCRVPEESFEFLRYALWGMSFEPTFFRGIHGMSAVTGERLW
jgi:hypothetical protein